MEPTERLPHSRTPHLPGTLKRISLVHFSGSGRVFEMKRSPPPFFLFYTLGNQVSYSSKEGNCFIQSTRRQILVSSMTDSIMQTPPFHVSGAFFIKKSGVLSFQPISLRKDVLLSAHKKLRCIYGKPTSFLRVYSS